jgi:hypothetical protein
VVDPTIPVSVPATVAAPPRTLAYCQRIRSNSMSKKAKSLTPFKYAQLLGPGPVLSSEHLSEYENLLMHLDACIQPRDFIEQMFVKDLADVTWEIRRLVSYKAMVIEREHQRHQEMEAKRRQKQHRLQLELAERRREKEAEQVEEATQADQATGDVTQFDRAVELDAAFSEAPADIDEILHEPADEIAHAKALESGINLYERVDRLETVDRARRNDLFGQIEFYRQGLVSIGRRASDEIIDGDFSAAETEAPSITGPIDGDEK